MSAVEQKLESVLEKASRDRDLAGIVVRVQRPDDDFGWTGEYGNLTGDSSFFIASTTKLYTTAIVLRMTERNELSIDDRLVDQLDADLVSGLHVYKGIDHTGEITVKHLLSQTSGLADYFQGKGPGGESLEDRLLSGQDTSWTAEEAIAMSRAMGARFEPGAGKKALYSDTNYQLLGRIIENVSGASYADVLSREVLQPLGLSHSYLFADPADDRPVPIRNGAREMVIPKAMTSFGPDGGVVSTVDDLMRFVRAFFEGGLFARETLEPLKTYRRIFYPLEYGVGFSRFRLARVFSPFGPRPELVGHSGLSGAFAFLSQNDGTYLAGTVNNLDKPGRSFRLMLRLLQAL